ncbi:coiled-coil domain-containing protein 169-like [Corticium candelabrum]|uniref:coiled-coil domain-containing protein 169-like n=1 Tax=Corticium candelabrum TaxID=121492 RepID=UPI002E276E13|nr:coiled-coil domain-containing protein 169-like [Corticium candelabrum]
MATTIEKLKAEILEEKRLKQALEESTKELSSTISELEEGFSKIETDGNEWQVRYQTQLEKNQQLEAKARQLEEDIKNAKQSKTASTISVNDSYQDMSDANLKQLLRRLNAEKKELEHQLKDYEWRLDRESRAFYKADEDRRLHMSELAHAQLLLSEGQGQKRQSFNKRQKDQEQKLSKHLAETASITNSPQLTNTAEQATVQTDGNGSQNDTKDKDSQSQHSVQETGDSTGTHEIK